MVALEYSLKKKLWVCTNCGHLYQLAPQTEPPRDRLGDVLCSACNDYQAPS